MGWVQMIVVFLRTLLRDRAELAGENLALRQQLAVLERTMKRQRIKNMGIEQVVTAPRSPWQNPFVERLIGSTRHECLNHVIVLNERHLRRTLTDYFHYYHRVRPHLSLDRNSRFARDVEPPVRGKVIVIPQVGGLHHRYRRAA